MSENFGAEDAEIMPFRTGSDYFSSDSRLSHIVRKVGKNMFLSLISGSSGNASVVTCGDTIILIDCGMSGKKLEAALAELDISCSDISAILLTHEHIDHTRGVGIVSRRYDIPIYATRGTHSNAEIGNIAEKNIKVIQAENEFEIGSVGICPFAISHDAAEPVGFSFFADGKKLTIATDSGEITDTMKKHILGSSEIILESNHDVDLLMYGTYPLSLKRRILSSRGHLSNADASKAAVELLNGGTEKIMLGHLSKENNTPDIAYETSRLALSESGAKIGKDILLSVANRHEITRF